MHGGEDVRERAWGEGIRERTDARARGTRGREGTRARGDKRKVKYVRRQSASRPIKHWEPACKIKKINVSWERSIQLVVMW